MKNNNQTVCIVGGGLAGIVSALTLRAFGMRVIILNKKSRHAIKPGDALSAQAFPILSRLGLLGIEALKKAPRIRGISATINGADLLVPWNGLLINRSILEEQLIKIAIQRGVIWHDINKLIKFYPCDKHWLVQIEKGSTVETLEAESLIDASGKHAVVARAMGSRYVHFYPQAASFDPLSGYGMTFALGGGYYGACALRNKAEGNFIAMQYYNDFIIEKARIVQCQTAERYPFIN